MIAAQYELWFKFKLKFVVASLFKLDPPELVQYEQALKDKDGRILGIAREEMLLTLKVQTNYQGEYLKDHKHALMPESFMRRCLDDFLFPVPEVPESQDPYGYDSDISWTEEELHNQNNCMED